MKPAVASKSAAYRPVHLGRRSRGPCARIDRIPWRGGEAVVELACDEFTSLCPVTGQPDFGSLVIRYAPGQWLVESKSLKLYLWQYRERGIFNEELVAAIADDLAAQLRQSLGWALNTLGNARSNQGDHPAAIEAYSRGLAHAPENAVLYRNRAGEHLELSQWAQAEADIDRAAALEPDAPRLEKLRQALTEQRAEA